MFLEKTDVNYVIKLYNDTYMNIPFLDLYFYIYHDNKQLLCLQNAVSTNDK